MKKLIVLSFIAALLASCSKGQAAEDELDTLAQAHPSGREMCLAEKKVAEGYLADDNVDKLKEWKTRSRQYCLIAEMNEQNTY